LKKLGTIIALCALSITAIVQAPSNAYSVTDTISVTGPKGVVVNASNTKAYIADQTNDRVHVIDLQTKTSIATIAVGDAPNSIVINSAGTKIYVTNYVGHSISVIDVATSTVSSTITTGLYPLGIAINPAGTYAYVTNTGSDKSISVINLSTNLVETSITLVNNPHKIAINPAGTYAYVTHLDVGKVSIVNLNTNTVSGSLITVGGMPRGLAIDPTGTLAFVSNSDDDTVSVIDLATNAVIGSPITVGSGPDVIVFNSLKREDIHKIIDLTLGKLFTRIAALGYNVELTEKAKDFLAEKGYDQQFGARPLNRAIQKYLEDAVAEEILKGEISEGGIIMADYEGTGETLTIKVKKAKASSKEKKPE
jgi:YVTN family beta-propeller protein